MNTESTRIPTLNLVPERGARRPRGRRRLSAAPAAPDRRDTPRQTGGGRVLRRWSVADLIARAGGAPRAMA